MSSGVTLTASMRSNLLSLQNTQKLFDTTQERLSTGKKVNSALDNPTSFFTAQDLSKRAEDLTGLLDTMGQAVQSLNAADQGLTTLTTLTEQAQSLVNSALDTSNTGSFIVGGAEISAYDNLADLGKIADGDEITIRTGDATELKSSLVLTGDQVPTISGPANFSLQDAEGNVIAESSIENPNTLTVDQIMAQIESDLSYDTKGENRVNIELVDGNMTITSNDKNYSLLASGTGASELGFDLGTTVTLTEATTINSDAAAFVAGAAPTAGNTITFEYGDRTITTAALTGTPDATAVQTAMNNALTAAGVSGVSITVSSTATLADFTGNAADTDTGYSFVAATASADTVAEELNVTSIGGAVTSVKPNFGVTPAGTETYDAITVKSFMDSINNGVEGVTASINDAGKLVITSDNGEDLIIQDASGQAAQDLGLRGVSTNGSDVRATYAEQFNDILVQINEIVGNDDTGYKGVNLLNGDDLTVNFNETRTSTLTVEGVTLNTQGLGLTAVDNEWTDSSDIEFSLRQVESALIEIEDVASTFAQNLSIVQTRQDFTENMVNILTTGADDLTLADMNEEAANMLALQTRQQLATNALSLSSQSAQSVLSLF